MRNIRCTIAYDGTKYDGWQRQGNTDNTIQGKIEHMFSKMLGAGIEIHGAGRTDAGVHAMGQVFHFYTETDRKLPELLRDANSYLPQDMSILSMQEMPQRFHSRLNAVSKWYRYVIDNNAYADVFSRRYAWHITDKLDTERMQQAAEQLAGTHDFKSFCANRRMKKSTVRTLYGIRIAAESFPAAAYGAEKLCLDFYGDGFLYNMVRILAGTLVEAGLGQRAAQDMTAVLRGKDRELAGVTAPPQGLFLMKVGYPGEECIIPDEVRRAGMQE